MTDSPPIILTLQLDAVTQDYFERQRQTFFPQSLNRVPAHLTLFHKLPGEELPAIVNAIGRAAPQRFAITVDGLRKLGRGVAFTLASPDLSALRQNLAERFAPWLTGQDREPFRPHVTVQNKVSPGEAKRTFELLSSRFAPFNGTAEGVQLWHYQGGPWAPAGVIAFSEGPPAPRRAKR